MAKAKASTQELAWLVVITQREAGGPGRLQYTRYQVNAECYFILIYSQANPRSVTELVLILLKNYPPQTRHVILGELIYKMSGSVLFIHCMSFVKQSK